MDSVRGLKLLPSINTLVSASEDATLKCWDIKKLVQSKDQGESCEPFITLRGHSEQIMSLGALENKDDQQLFLSGSSKGNLLLWKLSPKVQQQGLY